jgi:hypothetical protein
MSNKCPKNELPLIKKEEKWTDIYDISYNPESKIATLYMPTLTKMVSITVDKIDSVIFDRADRIIFRNNNISVCYYGGANVHVDDGRYWYEQKERVLHAFEKASCLEDD